MGIFQRFIVGPFIQGIQKTWTFLHSIRFRLTAWFVIILALVLLVFNAFVYTRQATDIQNAALNQMVNKARQILIVYRYAGAFLAPNWQAQVASLTLSLQPSLSKDEALVIIGPQGQIIQNLGPISPTDIRRLTSLNNPTGFNNRPDVLSPVEMQISNHQNYYFVLSPLLGEDRAAGWIIYGAPVDPGGQLSRLLITLLLASLATLGVALAGGYWLADRAMRPVHVITQAAHEIGGSDLSRRINLNSRDELGELANTFDEMLSRLQAAFERQRQFTADASHELRTPLTIVNLEAEHALENHRSPEEYERALGIIRSENEMMTRMVNDLLTLTRMDAGQAALKFEKVDLSDVALEVVERLTPLAERKGVRITTGELPELIVPGDRQYLTQMLSNLVENAIKYSGEVDPTIFVETGSRVEGRREVAWARVEDNGPGISQEHLPRLFDRFYRVDQARSHSTEANLLVDEKVSSGSGLGLAIVQWIVQSHKGKVTVRSEVGRGSVFEVTIPIA